MQGLLEFICCSRNRDLVSVRNAGEKRVFDEPEASATDSAADAETETKPSALATSLQQLVAKRESRTQLAAANQPNPASPEDRQPEVVVAAAGMEPVVMKQPSQKNVSAVGGSASSQPVAAKQQDVVVTERQAVSEPEHVVAMTAVDPAIQKQPSQPKVLAAEQEFVAERPSVSSGRPVQKQPSEKAVSAGDEESTSAERQPSQAETLSVVEKQPSDEQAVSKRKSRNSRKRSSAGLETTQQVPAAGEPSRVTPVIEKKISFEASDTQTSQAAAPSLAEALEKQKSNGASVSLSKKLSKKKSSASVSSSRSFKSMPTEGPRMRSQSGRFHQIPDLSRPVDSTPVEFTMNDAEATTTTTAATMDLESDPETSGDGESDPEAESRSIAAQYEAAERMAHATVKAHRTKASEVSLKDTIPASVSVQAMNSVMTEVDSQAFSGTLTNEYEALDYGDVLAQTMSRKHQDFGEVLPDEDALEGERA